MFGPGDEPAVLGDRIAARRDERFRGRVAELVRFRASLHDPTTGAVLFLHGPGGVGKSALLRRFATEARDVGRPVAALDARTLEPSPAGFEAEAAEALAHPDAVLLVDTFERCRGLEAWLRDRFLPRLPAGAVVVLAGRDAPEADWRLDPGWADSFVALPLANLPDGDARALLADRGVPAALHPALLAFTRGHPLALHLAATVATDDAGDAVSWTPTRDVLDVLLPRLVGEVPSAAHRHALEVCAHVRTTTVEVLRAAAVEDPAGMFDWLRSLPFVRPGPTGSTPTTWSATPSTPTCAGATPRATRPCTAGSGPTCWRGPGRPRAQRCCRRWAP